MFYKKYGKRLLDICGLIILLFVYMPAIIVIPILHYFFGQGSLVYKQTRFGLNAEPFVMFKFRTMIPEAHQMIKKVQHLSCCDYPDIKIINDPRVTSFGKVLRKLSLDEIPQLVNVLKGEMSLVGPRPKFTDPQFHNCKKRFSVKPGLTGLIQAYHRDRKISWVEEGQLEIDYVQKYNLWLDLKILLKTTVVVFQIKKAY